MEKITSFSNVKEFQEIFGKNQFGGRKNKILLTLLKCKDFWDYREDFKYFFEDVTSMKSQQYLFKAVLDALKIYSRGPYTVNIFGERFKNYKYQTDIFKGLCTDGDTSKIRVLVEKDSEKGGEEFVVRKTTPGKVFRQIIEGSLIYFLPEPVINFLCEQFTEYCISNAEMENRKYELIVDDDFIRIYNGYYLYDDFHSCMCGMYDVVYDFYRHAVKASAARLEDKYGNIYARCIIFNEVHDAKTDKVYRLAERQYSSNSNYSYMRILINKLIKGNYIDGYKTIGSGCHSPQDFVLNDGTPLDGVLWINCEPKSYTAYMDSFKYWLPDLNRAYNNENYAFQSKVEKYPYTLEYTNGRNPNAVFVEAYYNGDLIEIPENELDDYVWVEHLNHYAHEDDISYCEYCGRVIVNNVDDSEYSDYFDRYYCCEECLEEDIRYELIRIDEGITQQKFKRRGEFSQYRSMKFSDGRIMGLPKSFIPFCKEHFKFDEEDGVTIFDYSTWF